MSSLPPPEGSSSMTSSRAAIKCRKCRKNILEASPGMLNEEGEVCCESVQQILSFATNEDETGSSTDPDYPSWMNDLFDQAGWIRGKLLCPTCSAKVGAFNFVGGSRCQCRKTLVPSVYFVRAHIDVPVVTSSPTSLPDSGSTFSNLPTHSITTAIPVNEGGENSQNSSENSESQPGPSTNTFTHVGLVLIQNNEMVDMETFYDGSIDRTSEKMHRFETKLRTAIRRTRRGRVNRRIARIVKTVGYRVHESGNVSDGSHNEDDPDAGLDVEIDGEAQCAICLDVYCMPRRCAPCGHSFCGWCLRLLVHSATSNFFVGYHCPLCRAKIIWTEDDKACQKYVKTRYPSLVRRRLSIYRKQRRRPRWPLPEGTKWDQFLLAVSMRLPPRRCALIAFLSLALLLYFKWPLIQEIQGSLLTQIRLNSDIVSAIVWLFAVSLCFLLIFSA